MPRACSNGSAIRSPAEVSWLPIYAAVRCELKGLVALTASPTAKVNTSQPRHRDEGGRADRHEAQRARLHARGAVCDDAAGHPGRREARIDGPPAVWFTVWSKAPTKGQSQRS